MKPPDDAARRLEEIPFDERLVDPAKVGTLIELKPGHYVYVPVAPKMKEPITMTQKRYPANLEISGVDGCETPCTIHYHTHPAHKGSTDGRGGPKLEPDEPARLEIDWIEGPDGEDIQLADESYLLERLCEHEAGLAEVSAWQDDDRRHYRSEEDYERERERVYSRGAFST